jgi:hypothetical protein
MASEAVVLVDLFNVGPSARTRTDYEELVLLVGNLIRDTLLKPVPEGAIIDVDCRLYGGFSDVRGNPTEQFVQTQRVINRLRSLERRVRIRPQLVRALAPMPGAIFVGTYKNGGQKMVDQMLAIDAYHYAELGQDYEIGLIANDDDYVPMMLTIAGKFKCGIRWLRKRPIGTNDHLFRNLNISMLRNECWA